MPLKIRTTHGKTFHRCGIAFGKVPVIVDNETLDEPFGSPRPSRNRKKRQCKGDVLTAETMLICEAVTPAESVEPTKPDKPPAPGGK